MPLHGRISGSASVNGALQGSGTTDYNELNNKPKINNITLSGNKTAADLGLQDAISFPGDSSKYLDGSGNFSTPAGGSGDYEDLSNKPSINGVTLDGDNTSMSLGLEPAITYVGVDSMFYDGSGNFDYISYNEVTDKPSINSHVISGNMSDSDLDINYENLNYLPMINNVTLTGDKTADDLGLQDKIIYPEDSTLFLDGEGNFRTPDYFSGDYDDLTDKPEINGITLEGDKSGNELELTSGPIASGSGTSVNFTSEGAYNLLMCEVEFEPVQDLNGYDRPWVGGAGKNLFSGANTLKDLTESDGTFTNTATDTRSNFELQIIQYNETSLVATSERIAITSTGRKSITITINSTITKLRIKHNGQQNDIYLETPFTEQGTYTISINVQGYNPTSIGGIIFNDVMIESGSSMTTYEPYSNICPISGHSSVTINVSPTNDTSQGVDTTIQLGDTYYSGTLNVVTGELTVTHKIIDMGTLTWDAVSAQRFASSGIRSTVKIPSAVSVPFDGVSSAFGVASNNDVYNHTSDGIVSVNPSGDVLIYCSAYITMTGAQVKTAVNGYQLVYELATPITVQISPTVLTSLIGDNYISSTDGTLTIDAASEIYDPVLEYLVNHR